MQVTLLYFDGCPNWQIAERRLSTLADEFHLEIALRRVESPEDAEALGFTGSPTILFEDRDPFAAGTEPSGFACRVYQTPDGPQGSPSTEQLRRALRHTG